MQKLNFTLLPLLCSFVLPVAPVQASPWNQLTRLNVQETIQVPGATLPPGKYVMKLADSPSNRRIVQFFNEDQSKIYSTVLAISDQRMSNEVTGDTKLMFYETRGNEPPALRTWFYPGDMIGVEFVYPKSEANILSSKTGRLVPAMDDEEFKELMTRSSADNAHDVKEGTRVYRWSSEGKEVSDSDAATHNSRMDKEKSWQDQQKSNQRYYQFEENKSVNKP